MSDLPPADPSEVEAARAFVMAITWGEHRRVWELLGPQGRETVLRIAVSGGMDTALAARLRQGTASDAEENEFLTDLVNGLRADLVGPDLEKLEYELDAVSPGPGQARVILTDRAPEVLGGGPLPVASLELAHDGQGWRVEKMTPAVSR